MNKRVTLKLYEGSLVAGFSVILQMGEEGKSPVVELSGKLPPAPELSAQYQRWQAAYQQQDPLGSSHRIKAVDTGLATNVAIVEDCHHRSEMLGEMLNTWLRSDLFCSVRDKLLERLVPTEATQLILQTQDSIVQRLPWHLWEICARYPALEIALSAPAYDSENSSVVPTRDYVRILAVFGSHQGLDIDTDRSLLKHLPHADIHYLKEPDRAALDECLWDERGWDILFFAGHSSTASRTALASTTLSSTTSASTDSLAGELSINATDTITIPQLKHALRKAISRGLKIAIFNSCDGLGLAQNLADLRLAQIVVMREVVPDRVAHTFLKSFLKAFARGEPLYLAVREARERLYGLEDKFPCASWLPIIYQNPAALSPSWQSLYFQSPQNVDHGKSPVVRVGLKHRHFYRLSLAQLGVVIALLGIQSLGLLQNWELKMFDQLMRLRAKEDADARIVVVTVTEDDVRSQPAEDRTGSSLSDPALAAALVQLQRLKPRLIGLDIYRDFPARADQPALKTALSDMDNLYVVCKGSYEEAGIAPPPEVPDSQVGFSDAVKDPDGVLRRQLVGMSQAPSSPCQSNYNLSTLLALAYLEDEEISLQFLDEDTFQLGDVVQDLLKANGGGYHNIDAKGSQLLLNYRSLNDPSDIAEQLTLAELLAGDVSESAIRDRIVLIGTTADSFKDAESTPYSRGLTSETRTSGVFLQAQMISQLLSAALDGRAFIKTWPQWGEGLWLVVWAGAGGWIALYLKRREYGGSGRILLALLATEMGLLGMCWLLLTKAHYWVPWVPSAIAPFAVVMTDKLMADKVVVSREKEKS
ncbi:MAG: CHASE2 domain-containing protein [Phormidesmis sp.]